MATWMKRMALKNPNEGEGTSLEYTIFANGKGGIGRTRGYKTT